MSHQNQCTPDVYLYGQLHIVIKMSVIPQFTYLNRSLYSHGVITILYGL
jgi:hypothetical protein